MRALIAAVLLALAAPAHAGQFVTEFGAGYKLPQSTSYLLLPECHTAAVREPGWPDNPRPWPQLYSCGGDNPAFIGWPIAYEWESDVYRLRTGWFHYSNWFDGGKDRETHMDVFAVSLTVKWGQLDRSRR